MPSEVDWEEAKRIFTHLAVVVDGSPDHVALTSVIMLIAAMREDAPDISKFDEALYNGLDYAMGVR